MGSVFGSTSNRNGGASSRSSRNKAPDPTGGSEGGFADAATTRATYDEILTFRGTIKTRTPEKVTMTALREDPEITYNPTCLEMYLPDDEFHKVFGMAKDDFYRLRQWKQRELKKKAGLF